METAPHDFYGSKAHAIGLAVDFPFLAVQGEPNFKLNVLGRAISRFCDGVSPWVACSSVLCVGKAFKS